MKEQIEFLPDKLIYNGRAYLRDTVTALTWGQDSPECYGLCVGTEPRPSHWELEGMVTMPHAQPYLGVKDGTYEPPKNGNRYEVFHEFLAGDEQSLIEKILETCDKFRSPHFFCSIDQQAIAHRISAAVYDAHSQEYSTRPLLMPVISPIAPTGSQSGSQLTDYCENLVRSLIASRRLRIDSSCKLLLSENSLAVKALPIACYAACEYNLTKEPD